MSRRVTTCGALDVRADLESTVSGPVWWPGDLGIDAETAGFNTAARHNPSVVVGATTASDVVAAIRYAASVGLPVGVHATGHGGASSDAAVLVTTRRMDRFTVDAAARLVRVQAGVTWGPVIRAAGAHGLAPLSGSSSRTGAVGYTVCGGIGVLVRRFGFAADHVRSLQLVTADGRIRPVDAEREPDLFWAVRGGKANFGIVTELTMDLIPVARFYGGAISYPGAQAATVLHRYREWVSTLGEDTTTSIAVRRLPDLPSVPPQLRGTCMVDLRVAHLGSAADGERLLAPMRAAAPAVADRVRDMPFLDVDTVHDDPIDPRPGWGRGMFLGELPSGAIDALLAAAGPDRNVPLAMVEVRHIRGAAGRRTGPPNAATGRAAGFLVGVIGPYPSHLREVVAAAGQHVLDALAPWRADEVPSSSPILCAPPTTSTRLGPGHISAPATGQTTSRPREQVRHRQWRAAP
ncbi:MAG: FAD-binding oxidoreductase [Pseudonocardia sp.]|nr:FAD-binding oxidoreductase [Pseudonocardia sp.]